ncbi:hypothetical protein PR202_ga13197 [Eleusine coracana subsp. coracana]|uniref:Uncharacterized protein n=1 Tax=Eleusine coracana subsp. coracana TaxID=191504 RepID=A0AAV5CE48_ELECO|nr:hypothetical protein PR202_ga13197 [Eleusine coracana subsp. coracana]
MAAGCRTSAGRSASKCKRPLLHRRHDRGAYGGERGCYAEDAALCARCNPEVHATKRSPNPNASKHQHLPLVTPGSATSSGANKEP